MLSFFNYLRKGGSNHPLQKDGTVYPVLDRRDYSVVWRRGEENEYDPCYTEQEEKAANVVKQAAVLIKRTEQ